MNFFEICRGVLCTSAEKLFRHFIPLRKSLMLLKLSQHHTCTAQWLHTGLGWVGWKGRAIIAYSNNMLAYSRYEG